MYRSTCHRHNKCFISPNTDCAADQPVLSKSDVLLQILIIVLNILSSVIMTFTHVDGDLVLILLRNTSIISLDSWSDKHHATG